MSRRPPDDDTAPRYVYVREAEPQYVVPRSAPPRNQILLLLMLLLVVLLIAVATGRGMLLRFSGTNASSGPEPVLPTRVFEGEGLRPGPGCRAFAETGRQICGRIRQFYEQNGDVQAFGKPISDQRAEAVESKTFQAQWFERGRLELHPENAPPYDVLLGRLGAESLGRAGQAWQNFPRASSSRPYYFEKTSQAIEPEFWNYWSTRGLNFDGASGSSMEESLALFGYPISGRLQERGPNGALYMTQWFERARFEYHPEASAPNQVQVELFGSKLLPANSPPNNAYPTPARQP
jgi:hypothetical protein